MFHKDALVSLIRTAKTVLAEKKLFPEIEIRFGMCRQNKYIPGIPANMITPELHRLFKDAPWKKSSVVHTLDNVRSETCDGITQTHRKMLLKSIDIAAGDIGVRVALSLEEPAIQTGPPYKIFTKDRKTVNFCSQTCGSVVWQYTMTCRWCEGDKETHDCIEIEIECVNQEYFTSKSDEYLADTLLCKIHDLVKMLCGNNHYITELKKTKSVSQEARI